MKFMTSESVSTETTQLCIIRELHGVNAGNVCISGTGAPAQPSVRRQREDISNSSLSLQQVCSLHDIQKHTLSWVLRPSSLWSQLWQPVSSSRLFCAWGQHTEAEGCQGAADGQGRAARGPPKGKANNIQGNATGTTKEEWWSRAEWRSSLQSLQKRTSGLGLGMIWKWLCGLPKLYIPAGAVTALPMCHMGDLLLVCATLTQKWAAQIYHKERCRNPVVF